jgi:hypothetical protein
MNVPIRQGIPLRPDPDALVERHVTSLARAAVLVARKVFDRSPEGMEGFVRERGWQDDRTAAILTRAAVAPALTTQTGWAKELAIVTQSFVRTLVPMSAAAQLLDQAIQVSFNGTATITFPTILPGSATWVAEGQPIRVARMPTGPGPSMENYKLATIVLLTSEMVNGSNAEAIMRQALIDSTASTLDAALFSNAAGVAGLHPPGLFNTVTPITPSSSTSKVDAMDDDLAALVQAIAPRAGNSSIVFVAAPAQASRIVTRANDTLGPVLMSAAVPVKTVVAVATSALAAALEPVRIDAALSGVLHRDDTDPQPIDGAAPVTSPFQMDEVALRLRLPCSWTIRASGAVAVVSNVVW